MISTWFLRVYRQWHPRNTISPWFLKFTSNLRVNFVLKPRENSFSLWPGWLGFGNVGWGHIVHANSEINFRGLEAKKLSCILHWLRNNIWSNVHIESCPNFAKYVYIYQIWHKNFAKKIVFLVIHAVLGVCVPVSERGVSPRLKIHYVLIRYSLC